MEPTAPQLHHLEFRKFLEDKVRAQGLTFKKVSELTAIPPAHLENLADGDIAHLPPAPYVRGYFIKLGDLLGFEWEPWWDAFRASGMMQSSGAADALPINRFAPRAIAKYLWVAAAALLMLVYVGFRFSKIVGQPDLTVAVPAQDTITASTSTFTLFGTVGDGADVFVNGSAAPIINGSWRADIALQPGMNTATITAKKFLGAQSSISKQIFYEAPLKATTTTTTAPVR